MLILDTNSVAKALPYDDLIQALADAFGSTFEVPKRTHHAVDIPNGNSGTLLLMPAWTPGGLIGIKIVTVFPDNARQSCASVLGTYVLLSAKTGVPIAVLDGTELTLRRTASASALASRYLSRTDSAKLLIVGTGNLALHLIAAHATVRPIRDVCIWGRRRESRQALASALADSSFVVSTTENLEQAVRDADIISCATLATDPLIMGSWLHDGQHLDLVGAFTPDMCEADAECVRRADVYVDTRDGALTDAGEIIQAIQCGAILETDIRAELSELVTEKVKGRESKKAITLFKSVGTALEDLAAAELAIAKHVPNVISAKR